MYRSTVRPWFADGDGSGGLDLIGDRLAFLIGVRGGHARFYRLAQLQDLHDRLANLRNRLIGYISALQCVVILAAKFVLAVDLLLSRFCAGSESNTAGRPIVVRWPPQPCGYGSWFKRLRR